MKHATKQAPTCTSHDGLAHPDQETCARLMPRGAQQQITFLLMRHDGNAAVVAALLNVHRRTVKRHAKGSRLPPGRALRDRLREMTLDILCPVRVAQAAEQPTRRSRRRTAQEEL